MDGRPGYFVSYSLGSVATAGSWIPFNRSTGEGKKEKKKNRKKKKKKKKKGKKKKEKGRTAPDLG